MAAPGPFFIGWAATPRPLRSFLGVCAAGLVALFAAVAYFTSATADDPGDGAFRFDWGAQTVTGVLETAPYPILHVAMSERLPPGRTLMLSGVGKIGVQDRSAPLDGETVTASGVIIKRGELDMLQIDGRPDALAAAEVALEGPPPAVPLGRWRLTGEICDGKCYAGAMRPGAGLAHKACANLCLIGGVPPVFVTTAPVDGARFLMLGAADGGPVSSEIMANTATLVEIEGTVERRGDLRVFLIDPASVRPAR